MWGIAVRWIWSFWISGGSRFCWLVLFLLLLLPMWTSAASWLTDEKTTMRLWPNADEGVNQWTAVGCTGHWECIHEAIDDGDTSYLETGSSTAEDRVHVEEIPPDYPADVVTQVMRVETYIKAKDPVCIPHCGSVSAKIKHGTNMYNVEGGTAKTLTNTYTTYWFVWVLKPPICTPACNDTQPWTPIDIKNIVVSPVCVSGACRVTQMEVRVVWQRMARAAHLTAGNTAGVLRRTGSGLIYSAERINNFVTSDPDWDTNNGAYGSGAIDNGTGKIRGFWKALKVNPGRSRNNYLGQTTGDLRFSFVVSAPSLVFRTNRGGFLRFKTDGIKYLQTGLLVQPKTNDEVLRIITYNGVDTQVTDSSNISGFSANTVYLVTGKYDVAAKNIIATLCAYDLVERRCTGATLASASHEWTASGRNYDLPTGYLEWVNIQVSDTTDPVHVGMAQLCSSDKITVKGLPDHWSVKLHQDNGTLIASSTETTGPRTIIIPPTVPCVQYFSTLNIYDDTSMLVYQTHISNTMAGGDTWTWFPGESILIGPVVAAVDESSASIWVKGVKVGNFRVCYSTLPDGPYSTCTDEIVLSPSNRFTASVQLTGLTPNTTYYYVVQLNRLTETGIGQKSFRTACSSDKGCNVSFTFGACKQLSGFPFPIYCKINDRLNPDFHIEIGDFIYLDSEVPLSPIEMNEDSRVSMESRFIDVWLSPCFKALTSSRPSLFQRDDHEEINDVARHEIYPYHLGITNAVSEPRSHRYEAPSRADLAKEMNNYYWFSAIPDSLKRSMGVADGFEYAFSYGNIRFILPDGRWYRSDPHAIDDVKKSVFGSPQKTWLINQIQNPPMGTKIIFLVMAPSTKYATTDHNGTKTNRTYKSEEKASCAGGLGECTGGYETGLSDLWTEVCKAPIPVVVLSGDAHIGSVIYRTSWNKPGFGTMHCSDIPSAKRTGWYDVRSANLSRNSFYASGESKVGKYDGHIDLMVDGKTYGGAARHVAKIRVNTSYTVPKVFVDFYTYDQPARGTNGVLRLVYSRDLQFH